MDLEQIAEDVKAKKSRSYVVAAEALADAYLAITKENREAHNLLINLGRAVYDMEEADAAIAKFYKDHLTSGSVNAEAGLDMMLSIRRLQYVADERRMRVDELDTLFRKMAREKAVALYNEQNPKNPLT